MSPLLKAPSDGAFSAKTTLPGIMDVAAHIIGRQHTVEEHRIRKDMRLLGTTKDVE